MIRLKMRENDLRDAFPCIVVVDSCVRFGKQTDFHVKLPRIGTFDDGDRTGGGRHRPRGGSRREGRRDGGRLDGGGKRDALKIACEFGKPFQ